VTALLWPAHEHHEAAHRWFAGRGKSAWATCPLTQLGFVRIVSNPAFSREALPPARAAALLADNVRHDRHEFWRDTLAVAMAVRGVEARLQGYRQVTDAYLLALADAHDGVLATFDRGIAALAADAFDDAVEIVPTPSR
jgi:toxin-antitoxin system PIN domain toxin